MRPSSADLLSVSMLMTLAAKKGYALEASTMPGGWSLIGRDRKPARGRNGALAFTLTEALAFLKAQPDA
jgi:hypothetical protein